MIKKYVCADVPVCQLKNGIKSNTAITLIALIITIIVLLILAGITLNMVFGDSGTIAKAQWSKFTTNFYNEEEAVNLYAMQTKLEKYGNKSKLASTETIVTKTGEEKEIYPIKDEQIQNDTLSNELLQVISTIENLEEITEDKVEMYNVDNKKINIDSKDEYIVNVKSGKIYLKEPFRYKGKNYYRPEYGIDKNGDIETEIKEVKIHYLPGYSGENEYTQIIPEDSTTVTLDKVSFKRSGYTFVRWKDVTENYVVNTEEQETNENDEDIESVEEDVIYYEDKEEIETDGTTIYLEAEWTQYVVTLDANGGMIEGQSTYTYPVIDGEEYGEIPDPERTGYVFGGWHTDNETFQNQIVGSDIYVNGTSSTTLYAYWKEETSPDIAIVTYNANGGTCTKTNKKVVKNKKIGSLPNKKQTKKATYKFDCWTLEDKETKVNKKYVVTEDITLYARYTIHMYFDYQGGTYNPKYRKNCRVYKNVKIGGIRGYLYTYAMNKGYKNEGWYTDVDGQGTRMGHYTKITQTSDFTIYANWRKQCTVTYNLNYETETTIASKKIYEDSEYGKLATPKRTGYAFNGWYTSAEGGTQITSTDIVVDDITLYAHWTELEIAISAELAEGNKGTEIVVTIDYKNCSTSPKYKIGANNTTWTTYSSSFSVTSYTVLEKNYINDDRTVTISARGKDSAGNLKTVDVVVDLLDLDMPSTPVITFNGYDEYPTLTENGVKILNGYVNISFDSRKDITNYYSIDGGTTWNEYTGQFNNLVANGGDGKVYAKSTKNSTGLEISTSTDVPIASDALGIKSYNGNTSNKAPTWTSNGTKVSPKRLNIDPVVCSKDVQMYITAHWDQGYVWIKFYGSQDTLLETYTYKSTTDEWKTIQIPENSEYLKVESKYSKGVCDIKIE